MSEADDPHFGAGEDPDPKTLAGQLAIWRMQLERGDLLRFPRGEERASVWLVQDADDFGRMHEMIALRRGGQSQVYELAGWKEEKPVQRLLAVAGFVSGGALGLRAKLVDSARPTVDIMGFDVPALETAAVEAKVRDAIEGRLGGFSPVVLSQTAFHRAPVVFEMAWHAAGCPAIQVRHPTLVENNEESGSVTTPVMAVAKANPTLSAIMSLEKGE